MTTWDSIVGIEDARIGVERACLFCGVCHIGKLVYTQPYMSQLEAYDKQLMSRVALNLCREAIKYDGSEEDSTVHVCCACDHWLRKRKDTSKFISAYDAMFHFFQTFIGEQKKTFDLRILKRLCTALHQESQGRKNYYQTVLTPSQYRLTLSISCAIEGDIDIILANHHHSLNGLSLFSVDRRAAERLREHSDDY